MIRTVAARACANIALVKYWGKRDEAANVPATPSISITLSALTTTTIVKRLSRGKPDSFEINGKGVGDDEGLRLFNYLNLWRSSGLIEGHFSVDSTNSFPTGAGLASSASGFAALATALAEFSEQNITQRLLSRMARRGSASAARSIPGGIVMMGLHKDPTALRLLRARRAPWGMVVAEVESGAKEVSSSEGMKRSRETCRFFDDWIGIAKTDFMAMKDAVRKLDFTSVGKITEANSYAMHATMLASHPPLLYWNDATMRLLKAAPRWRDDGLECYTTVDAGPHVCFLARRQDLEEVHDRISRIEGVRQAIINLPGPRARVLEVS